MHRGRGAIGLLASCVVDIRPSMCYRGAQVAADGEEAEKVKITVAAEEKDVKVMQTETQAIADDARADLAEALPALNAAVDSLKALNKNDITEIKSFPKPPPLVQMTMEAVCILKGEKPDWDTAKKLLSDTNFLKSLEEFDKDNIPDAAIKKLKKYVDDPVYTPEAVAKQSRAAMSLCMWSRAMEVYNRVAKVCTGATSWAASHVALRCP
jgi:dynein heavy chain, axonemal